MTFIHIFLDSIDPCEEDEGDGGRGRWGDGGGWWCWCFSSVHWLHFYVFLALKQILSQTGGSELGRMEDLSRWTRQRYSQMEILVVVVVVNILCISLQKICKEYKWRLKPGSCSAEDWGENFRVRWNCKCISPGLLDRIHKVPQWNLCTKHPEPHTTTPMFYF